MNLNMKRMLSAIATSLVAFSVLSAADASSSGSMKSSNKNTNNQNQNGMMGGVQGGYDLSITAAALLWKTNQGGTEFAAGAGNRHVETMSTDWDWGFRVGLGYTMPHDRWNVTAMWDHLHVGASESTGAGWSGFGGLAGGGLAVVNGTATTATSLPVSSHWHLGYDAVDLMMKRDFQFSKWVCVAPSVGLRSAWIYQNQSYTFGKGTATSAEMKSKNHFWGLGIRAGVDSVWGMGRGWSIYGGAAAALLYGNNKVNSTQTNGTLALPVALGSTGWAGSEGYHSSHACADYTLGLRWNHMFSDNRYGLTFQLGYEQHIYWNMYNATQPAANAHDGDLTMTGWTLTGRFDF